jgi:hypothetical protein
MERLADEGVEWECRLCDGEGKHHLGCALFDGEVTREDLARFLFNHSNASNDGPRIKEMMTEMAEALLEKLGISPHPPGGDELWREFLGPEGGPHAKCHCGLCGNSGMVDTVGKVRTPARLECGVRTFCICPNGRQLRRLQGTTAPATPPPGGTEYRPGLPSVEDVRAHEERGKRWHRRHRDGTYPADIVSLYIHAREGTIWEHDGGGAGPPLLIPSSSTAPASLTALPAHGPATPPPRSRPPL